MTLAPEDRDTLRDDADDLLDYTPSGLWFLDDPEDDSDDGDGETDRT